MSEASESQSRVEPGSPEDPYVLGWRYVRRVRPDGAGPWRVPLTREDVLYPEEDDFVAHPPAHNDDRGYLKGAFHLPGAVVLCDERTDFEVAGIRPLGPDLGVYTGVAGEVTEATFRVASRGARPELVVEITSSSTRDLDFGEKVGLYFRAGVPLYVIVDHGEDRGAVRLVGHRATPLGYMPLRPDERGRLWLEPVRLWLAVEGGRAVCYDEHRKRVPDYQELLHQVLEARARRQEIEAQIAEDVRARKEAEAQSAEHIRARKQIEAETAEIKAQTAELIRQRKEAEAQSAEHIRARKQIEAETAELATRLQQLEAELRRLRGQG
jgi:hypothetical protein